MLIARTKVPRPARGIALHGSRGAGKTVLLRRFQELAVEAGWFTVVLESKHTASGRRSVREKLSRELSVGASKMSHAPGLGERVKRALGTVTSFSMGIGLASIAIGVAPTAGRADSGSVEVDLEELVEDLSTALGESESTFALFIHEMQELEEELMVAVLAAQHQAGQNGWPFYVIGAGLPNLPSALSTARTYAERLFDYRHIGPFDDVSARSALVDPILADGAHIDDDAVEILLAAAAGQPFFVQTFEHVAWDGAEGDTITALTAIASVTAGFDFLDYGFFACSWGKQPRRNRDTCQQWRRSATAPIRLKRSVSR